jgi:hypothetical protein
MDDLWHEGIAAMQRAVLAERRGQTPTAEDEAVAAIERFREVGDMCTLVPMLTQYRRMLQSNGRFEEAESAISAARAVSESSGLRGWTSATSARLGELAMLRGDAALPAEHSRAAIELARELALPAAEAEARVGLRRAVAARSDAAGSPVGAKPGSARPRRRARVCADAHGGA